LQLFVFLKERLNTPVLLNTSIDQLLNVAFVFLELLTLDFVEFEVALRLFVKREPRLANLTVESVFDDLQHAIVRNLRRLLQNKHVIGFL
jgi:hypothetical protein